MDNLQMNRNIICIDLKSFFASVECIERGLDPFTTPLVVCDPTKNGAITLAVTPYMKKYGIKGRTRVFKIPKNIKYIKAPPRMRLYQEKSKEVIKIYLDYVAPEDLHIYSIDECFLDVTDYLTLYQKNDYELAVDILNTIFTRTGLTATAGIGPNLLLAKVAMDVEAKHNSDNIAKWEYEDIEDKLWPIKPLSKMWGIGPRMERHLNDMGLTKVGDIAKYSKEKLRCRFGILGEELWYHANGIDNSKISDLHNQEAKEKSISHSQVLFKDYYDFNISIIIYEMIDVLCRRLRNLKELCGNIGFGCSYSRNVGGGFYHSLKLDTYTNDENIIYKTCMMIFDKFYDNSPIRKVSIRFGSLVIDNKLQLNLFENYEEIEAKKNINKTIDEIKMRFGNNAILKTSSLLNDSTIRERNHKIGGHHE